MNWFALLHTVHVLAAGIWVGGLVFTATVVTPAFRRLEWSPVERIAVRSAVGRQYAKVASLNLMVLFIAAVADAATRRWTSPACVEIALILFVVILSALHAQVLAPRLGQAAGSDAAAARQYALRVSIGVSMLNLLLSLIVAVLAA